MMRPVVNLILTTGYIVGFVFLWVGIDMLVLQHRRVAPALLSITIGIALWAVLVRIGKSIRAIGEDHRHEECR